MKFVDELPPAPERIRRDRLAPVMQALHERPGQWAEIETYEPLRVGTARSRGRNIEVRYPGIEYAVRIVDGKAVLYLRATDTTTGETP